MQSTGLSPQMIATYRGEFLPSRSLRSEPLPHSKTSLQHRAQNGPGSRRSMSYSSLGAHGRTARRDSTTGRSSSLPRPGGASATYEVGGSLREGYRLQNVVHDRHPTWEDERGAHLVGHVAPDYLERLETRFALVPLKQGRPDWNCQTWVVEALQGLNDPHMCAVQMDYGQCYQQMEIVERAWNAGDALGTQVWYL